jgi:1-acyl-sn-glycerol-3-phosphate acyltransferase
LLRGIAVILLLTANLFLAGTPILLLGLVKLLLFGKARSRLILFLAFIADGWVANNDRIFEAFLDTHWDVEGVGAIERDGHHLIVSNHVSWVDILVLFRVFHHKTAILRFFLKRVLIWMPVVGLAAWALDFPFMRRYTPEYLAKHPEKRGRDLDTTRIACRRYRHVPVAILNFIEGTRFTAEKHEQEDAPYRHLLRPRIGGVAFVLASLGEQLDTMLDVTIVYPAYDISFWQFVSNQVPRITVRVRDITPPAEFYSPAITEPGPTRERFKAWLDAVWREKDALMEELGNVSPAAAEPTSA